MPLSDPEISQEPDFDAEHEEKLLSLVMDRPNMLDDAPAEEDI